MEDHCDVEPSKPRFEANFIPGFFKDDFFAFVLVVSVVELWDLSNDPERLSVQLLFQVGVKHILQLELVVDRGERQYVA
jgi:hypothetical protein